MPTIDPTQFFTEYVTAILNYMPNDSCESFFFTFGINDINPTDIAKMQADCTGFLQTASSLLAQGENVIGAGEKFLLTRNREGTGYWASVWPPNVAQQLTVISQSYPEQHALIDINGNISICP